MDRFSVKAVSLGEDGYLDLRKLAGYACISVRKLRDLLNDPFSPLPHFRVGGKILVRKTEFDRWLESFRINNNLEEIAQDAIKEVMGGERDDKS